MKTVRVKCEVVLEVPDEWELVEPNEEVGPHLKAGDQLLQPELFWLVYQGGTPEEGYNWDHVEDDLADEIDGMKVDWELEMSEK